MESWWMRSHWSGDNTPLALTWSEGQLDRPNPINRQVLSCPHARLFFPKFIIQSALAEQCPTFYLIGARRRGLRVNCVKRKRFLTLLDWVIKTRIWHRLEILLMLWVYWYCIPIKVKANGFTPWFIPFSSWTPWWVVDHRTSEKYITDMASFSNK